MPGPLPEQEAPELLLEPAVPGLRELPVPPEQRVLAPLRGQEQRSELPVPRALPKWARLAQRLELAALQARRAGPKLAAFPGRRALGERPSADAAQAS